MKFFDKKSKSENKLNNLGATFPSQAVSIPELPVSVSPETADAIVLQKNDGTYSLTVGDLFSAFVQPLRQERIGVIEARLEDADFTVTVFGVTFTYLLMDGRTIDPALYPELITKVPALANSDGTYSLKDPRGYGLRGLDKTGSIDPDGAIRTLGSLQQDALQNITGRLWKFVAYDLGPSQTSTNFSASGVFRGSTYDEANAGKQGHYGTDNVYQAWDNEVATATNGVPDGVNFDASLVARTSVETHGKNMAVNYFICAR